MSSRKPTDFKLIVTIVDEGRGEDVLQSSVRAGAEGGTCLGGRGLGIHETQKILGIPIEPRKDIVFTVTHRDDTERILEGIRESCGLDRPGHGIGFVIDLDRVVGMPHLFEDEA